MSGRIRDEDVAYIRDRAPIDEIVSDYVQLKSAGGGAKKGLCPFHDEKSPSFTVTPSKGFFHCFGCQTGGDVIAFLMKIDHLTFTETIERLADRLGYTLRYEEGSSNTPTFTAGARSRLIAANTEAAKFYSEQLNGPNHIDRQSNKYEKMEYFKEPEDQMIGKFHTLQRHHTDPSFEIFLIVENKYPKDIKQ